MAFHILCAIDGQQSSIRAAQAAFDLAIQVRGVLTLCMVNPIIPGRAVITRWPQQHVERILDEAARHAKWAGVVDIKTETWQAIYVADSIVGYADAHDTDLIIAGFNGRPWIVRALRGSVAAALIGRANCPVLLVRRRRDDVPPTRRRRGETRLAPEPRHLFEPAGLF